ncbi:MAG: hypothetical protein M3Q42_05255 [Pseudomonadota bacterium]|nr:hypothetical protein [Pseudomonadota bacterium]
MTQSKRMSAVETAASTAIGFAVAFVVTAIVLPVFGYHITAGDNLWITAIFTVVSVVRGYYVRRLFNWLHARSIQ